MYRLYSMYLLKQVAAHYEGDNIPATPPEHPPVERHLQNGAHGIHLQGEEEAEYEEGEYIYMKMTTGLYLPVRRQDTILKKRSFVLAGDHYRIRLSCQLFVNKHFQLQF